MVQSQREQSEVLREQNDTLSDLRSMLARIDTRVDAWHQRDAEQDKRLDTQSVRVSGVEKRLDELEDDRIRRDTALKITWAIMAALFTAVGGVLQWLLSR